MSQTEKIKEEVAAVLPPTLFFFVALHLIALVRTLMLEGSGIKLGTSLSVTIAALVLGKAVRHRSRQRKDAGGEGLAAFLGNAGRDRAGDLHVLHDARDRARDRRGQGPAHGVRAAARRAAGPLGGSAPWRLILASCVG